MSGGKRQTERGDARGGSFFLLPQCLLASEAFRTASPRAVKLLLLICGKHNGFNNRAIGLGFREIAALMDSQNHAGNSRALCELVQRGLLAVARTYPRGQRLANEYQLTFVQTGNSAATNDYLSWRVGDAGTRKKVGNFRALESSARTGSRVVETKTGEETTRSENLNASDGKPPFLGSPRAAITSTHIVQPFGGLSESPSEFSSIAERGRSAAPDALELRERLAAALDGAERGSQGQLAALASIRPAALSKFLHGSGTLNSQARIRLTMALPRIAAFPWVAA